MSNLKACPFCGQNAEICDWWRSETGTVYYVRCTGEMRGTGCRISTGAYPSTEEAIKAWNTRPIEDALLFRAKKAETMLEDLKLIGSRELTADEIERAGTIDVADTENALIASLRERAENAEAIIRGMFPMWTAAMSYCEHGMAADLVRMENYYSGKDNHLTSEQLKALFEIQQKRGEK